MLDVAQLAVERDINIIPASTAIELVEPTAIETAPSSRERDYVIIVDIVLDTIGFVKGDRALIIAVLDTDPEFKRLADGLLVQVTTKNWEEAAKAAEAIFKFLVALKIWKNLPSDAVRRIGLKLVGKCVPVLGWIYCCIALIISIKQNYNRFSFST